MAYTTINKSTAYFNTKLYTGNGTAIGSGGNAQTGVGFQPDWVWIKDRSATNHHNLFDAVRGVTKGLQSSQTNAEYTNTETVTAFGTDGFTVGDAGGVNTNSNNYVAWNWKAGGGQGSSNTNGSINTAYTSVDTTAGFSISTYTGTGSNATVGHGLGVAPSIVLIKVLNTSNVWAMYHKSTGATHYLQFDTSTSTDNDTYWNDTAPTNDVFTIGTASPVNVSSNSYVAYCFAEKTGYSKFGKYVGTADANGPFIYTGFKPKFIIIKSSTSGEGWHIFDNLRANAYNPHELVAPRVNSNSAESTSSSYGIDLVSNGFKLKGNGDGTNGSGQTYIYMAFGQSLVGSNNVPCTAR